MTFPEPPQKGQPVRAELIRQIIDCLRMFRPIQGVNIRTQVTPGGTIINGTPGTKAVYSETEPFTVRYHEDQWEIYLPDGCCNYGASCTPINEAASSAGGVHQDDKPAWRILTIDERAGTSGTDDDGNEYREWNVELHVKPSAKIFHVDDLNKPARRLMWASASDNLKKQADLTEKEIYANTPGDSWTCIVARVRVTKAQAGQGENDEPSRSVSQLRKTKIDVSDYGETLAGFGLVWYFSVNAGALKVEKLYCVRQIAAAAGIALTGNQMTDVTDAESSIYARIDGTDMNSGTGKVDVLKDPAGVTSPGPHVVWLPLYEMKLNTVTSDLRAQALANIQLFHA